MQSSPRKATWKFTGHDKRGGREGGRREGESRAGLPLPRQAPLLSLAGKLVFRHSTEHGCGERGELCRPLTGRLSRPLGDQIESSA